MKFYSQNGQDKYIYNYFFKNAPVGFFLDVGAHNGVTFSNTYFFEKQLGWSGICIEPNQEVFNQLIKNRPNCININGCVSKKDELAVFWQIDGYAEMLSGLVNVYAPEHINRIHREIELKGGKIKESLVQCYRLDSLLNLHNIVNIDYCSIDVEGAEMQVLESIDFERVKIKVITIENNYKTSEVKMFMKKNKYIYFGKIGSDEIYIISDSYKINFMYFIKKIRLIIKSINESILFYFKTRIFGSGSLKHTKNS